MKPINQPLATRLSRAGGGERGIALLVVMIVVIMLILLGLSMTFDSMTDVSLSNEMENRRKAFANADTGYNEYKSTLRGVDLTTVLSDASYTKTVPRYIDYPTDYVPTDATALAYFDRNPIYPLEAMNVDFDNLPAQLGTRTVKGLMTDVAGEVLPNGGRYWVKLTDNDDGDSDLDTDQDGTVYMRVLGIQPLGAGQASTYGGTVKNSTIIEVKLERDLSFDLSAPFSLYGSSANPAQGANYFSGGVPTIDGFDHPNKTVSDIGSLGSFHTEDLSLVQAGIEVMNNDPGANDAEAVRDLIWDELDSGPGNHDKATGVTTDYPIGARGTEPGPQSTLAPSLRDVTQEVRAEAVTNPDAANIFNATYLEAFVRQAGATADIKASDFSGNPPNLSGTLGTEAAPKITYCASDCRVGGNTTGVGLFIVRGRLDVNAGVDYRGLILVVGDGEADLAGLNGGILGGLFVAKLIDNGDSTFSFGIPEFRLAGNTNFYFQGSGLSLAYSLFPTKATVWREITPEIEPPQP